MNILSLGAGVQSSTVFLMSCRGVLPKLDGAIFADTGWEPAAVYAWIEEVLKPEGKRAGIPIHVCSAGNLRSDALRSTVREYGDDGRWASMPLFTKANGVDGGDGQLRRQCTKEYKIEPVRATLRTLLKGKPKQVRLWMGISADEMRRMRMADVRWIENYYPLIFGLERPWHRHDCLQWLRANGFAQAPRSACIGCPYHNNKEWRTIKNDPVQWADAVSFDAAIRDSGLVGQNKSEVYLHRTCAPLPMVDLESLEDKGQTNWIEECEGMCGI